MTEIAAEDVTLTEAALQAVLKMCRIQSPQESCGFIVTERGTPTIGSRAHFMKNVHQNPARHYRMDDDDVVSAMAEFDKAGEEPVIVFHSHTGPGAEAIMSDEDVDHAVDDSITHLIIALGLGNKPTVRAYRVRRFIGSALVRQVRILIQDKPSPSTGLPSGFNIPGMREELRRDIAKARLFGGEKDWREGHAALASFYDSTAPGSPS